MSQGWNNKRREYSASLYSTTATQGHAWKQTKSQANLESTDDHFVSVASSSVVLPQNNQDGQKLDNPLKGYFYQLVCGWFLTMMFVLYKVQYQRNPEMTAM